MNKQFPLAMAAWVGILAVAGTVTATAADWTTYKARPGSKIKIEGTSTIHDWAVETSLIGGTMKLGPNFPLTASANAKPGPVEAEVEAVILTSSIKSGKKSMDEVMHETMEQKDHPRITYQLQSLALKEAPQADNPAKFDAVGVLTVAGVKSTNQMEVVMQPSSEADKILVKGSANLKMTQFGMKPPSPAISLGLIKTGDDVKVSFEWVTAKAE